MAAGRVGKTHSIFFPIPFLSWIFAIRRDLQLNIEINVELSKKLRKQRETIANLKQQLSQALKRNEESEAIN